MAPNYLPCWSPAVPGRLTGPRLLASVAAAPGHPAASPTSRRFLRLFLHVRNHPAHLVAARLFLHARNHPAPLAAGVAGAGTGRPT
ncbi:hypothetical protein GUJ93_ZPchr0015g6637 [Zizania palustris]|uniref:Uncharacterized protein n=1 Tax=Zizania palustris TaxID=103762 RepID=A0A8J5W103_ZIZPA|nr:hypothetical protein GUJ93_ZPchr0015g6637 [Zizania palustris]